ncbi:MAG: UvrD-helicase domain-containing protein [Rhodobacteraceae bacterium]|nr:UvrD-helicase domain-containing protein [Paracoccaceae bacterium]
MNDWDYNESDAFDAAVPLSQRAMQARPVAYMEGLNPEQKQAVETLDGPVLMLAGAGTGKTKALTARIAHLLHSGRARPNEILAVTFTNKAAKEMKERVGVNLGGTVEGLPWMGTFHSICVKLLRRHAELAGLKSSFTILDTDDQIRLMKQLIRAEDIDEKRFPPRMLAGVIDSWKNRALTPSKVPSSEAGHYNRRGVELYGKYQARLITLNAVDFGDLLLHVVQIFQAYPDILAKYQSWFKYILVDEYQDTNVAQYLWLRLLASGHKNICCVGDDDQSIYGWRGAEVGNILRFEKDFPGAHVVRLEQNYRSTPHILAAATAVIDSNENRLGKTLWTAEKEGEKVRLIGHWDGAEEARWIGEKIESLCDGSSRDAMQRNNPRSKTITQEFERLAKKGALAGIKNPEELFDTLRKQNSPLKEYKTRKLMFDLTERLNNQEPLDTAFHVYSPEEMAILVRASHQMRAFEDRFMAIGIPYRVIGGPRFYERLEIRDAMAYFRVVVSPDDGMAFDRIVNNPKRALGDKALQIVAKVARDNGVSPIEGARIVVAEKALPARACKSLNQVLQNFDRWRQSMLGGADHIRLAETILDESGYMDRWKNDKSIEAEGRLENLKELIEALDSFENLQGFLEHVSLVMETTQTDSEEKVSIMTLHAAKGLEFPCVFLPGWEDGLFPSQRSMDESGLKGEEEERRLAYVGITRAEELCTISFVANRQMHGRWQNALPSRFIDELPPEHVEVLTPPGLYGGNYGAAAPKSHLESGAQQPDTYRSPGWQRLQSQTRHSNAPRARHMVEDAVEVFELGERVFHQKFGYGAVVAVDGEKLSVAFEKSDTKNVMSGYVTRHDDVPF